MKYEIIKKLYLSRLYTPFHVKMLARKGDITQEQCDEILKLERKKLNVKLGQK